LTNIGLGEEGKKVFGVGHPDCVDVVVDASRVVVGTNLRRFLKLFWCGAIGILPFGLRHTVLNVGCTNPQKLEMIRSFAPQF
jgi:hypothetical protein